LQNFEPIFQKV